MSGGRIWAGPCCWRRRKTCGAGFSKTGRSAISPTGRRARSDAPSLPRRRRRRGSRASPRCAHGPHGLPVGHGPLQRRPVGAAHPRGGPAPGLRRGVRRRCRGHPARASRGRVVSDRSSQGLREDRLGVVAAPRPRTAPADPDRIQGRGARAAHRRRRRPAAVGALGPPARRRRPAGAPDPRRVPGPAAGPRRIMKAETLAGAFIAVSLFLGAGLGLTLCLPGFARTGLAGRLGFAWLLGVAWIGLFLYAASHFAHLPLDGPLVFLAAFLPLAAGLAAAVRLLVLRRWRAPRTAGRPLWTLALSLLASLVSTAVLANALTHPLADWDGRMTWTAQAMFVRDAGTVDAEVLRFPKSFISHPRYPLLMPPAQIAALEAAGSDDERIVQVLYAMFFPALVLLVLEAGRRWAGSRAALLTALALLTIPWIPFDPEGGATGAYSDLPLACFFGGGLLLLLRGRPRASDGVAAGVLLGGGPVPKNQGAAAPPPKRGAPPEALTAPARAGGSGGAALLRHRRSGRSRLLAAALACGL